MLALTPGEPGGIGADIVVRLCQSDCDIPFVVFSDSRLLEERARALQLPLTVEEFTGRCATSAKHVSVVHTPMNGSFAPGKLDVANVEGLLNALSRAIDGCLEGTFEGLVTGPMQKSIVNDSGVSFSGHTEFLAERSGVEDVVMMLANSKMRVALATTHLPLIAVPAAITQELLGRRLRILIADLENKFGIENPTILVAGLNPHAGEGGHLGREELDVINPVCEEFRAAGRQIVGPLPADTLFTDIHLNGCDAVLAMYHDQGLPVLKYSGFGEAVNITLGLPFVRTSVDHGTALDVTGTDLVSTTSMQSALEMAWTMTGSNK